MWYQLRLTNTGEELGKAEHTIGGAIRLCQLWGPADYEVVGTDTGKIHAVIVAGELVGGTPNAIAAARARGMLVDEGR